MPEQALPAKFGGTICTGLIDVRQANGNLPRDLRFEPVNFTLYDLPPNGTSVLRRGSLDMSKFYCPDAYALTLNANDVISIILDSTDRVVMIYDHTMHQAGYQKTFFYKEAFKWQELVAKRIFLFLITMMLGPLMPAAWFIILSKYGSDVVRPKKDQQCQAVTGWIIGNINVIPQRQQTSGIQSV